LLLLSLTFAEKKMKVLLALCLICEAVAFAPRSVTSRSTMPRPLHLSFLTNKQEEELSSLKDCLSTPILRSASGMVVGLSSGLNSFASIAAAADDIEMADLPPPYVPVLFSVALLAGVALLTGSLGDVIDEEAGLGLQSGARAKKEIDRSRSSYFKKK